MQILITGAAGFIGADLSQKLLSRGHTIVGIDNFNDYYDVSLKRARLNEILQHSSASAFSMQEVDIVDRDAMASLFEDYQFDELGRAGRGTLLDREPAVLY